MDQKNANGMHETEGNETVLSRFKQELANCHPSSVMLRLHLVSFVLRQPQTQQVLLSTIV